MTKKLTSMGEARIARAERVLKAHGAQNCSELPSHLIRPVQCEMLKGLMQMINDRTERSKGSTPQQIKAFDAFPRGIHHE